VEASVNELPVKVIQSARQPVMCEKSFVATAKGGWGEGGRGTTGERNEPVRGWRLLH